LPIIKHSGFHVFRILCVPDKAGHFSSEGRVRKGKSEGRIGFFQARVRKEKEGLVQKILLRRKKEGLVQKILLRRKNEGRCWFRNFEKEGLETAFSSFQNRSF